jgi:hypothetical protein
VDFGENVSSCCAGHVGTMIDILIVVVLESSQSNGFLSSEEWRQGDISESE